MTVKANRPCVAQSVDVRIYLYYVIYYYDKPYVFVSRETRRRKTAGGLFTFFEHLIIILLLVLLSINEKKNSFTFTIFYEQSRFIEVQKPISPETFIFIFFRRNILRSHIFLFFSPFFFPFFPVLCHRPVRAPWVYP